MNWTDTPIAIGVGAALAKLFDLALSSYRNKQQVSKDTSEADIKKSEAKKEDISVGEQALQLVNQQMSKIQTLMERTDHLETENSKLKEDVKELTAKNKQFEIKVEELTKENTFLKGQIEMLGKVAKQSIPRNKNLN